MLSLDMVPDQISCGPKGGFIVINLQAIIGMADVKVSKNDWKMSVDKYNLPYDSLYDSAPTKPIRS